MFLRKFITQSISLALLCTITLPTSAVDVINGNACVAANLNQAFELQWNHARVINPASNTTSRFVTCSLTTGQKWLNETGTSLSEAISGGITAYFDTGAANDAEVSCIFREVGNTETALAALDSSTLVITAGGSLPDTTTATFAAGAGIGLGTFLDLTPPVENTRRSLTVTCNLDPGTGITTIWVDQTLPPSS